MKPKPPVCNRQGRALKSRAPIAERCVIVMGMSPQSCCTCSQEEEENRERGGGEGRGEKGAVKGNGGRSQRSRLSAPALFQTLEKSGAGWQVGGGRLCRRVSSAAKMSYTGCCPGRYGTHVTGFS